MQRGLRSFVVGVFVLGLFLIGGVYALVGPVLEINFPEPNGEYNYSIVSLSWDYSEELNADSKCWYNLGVEEKEFDCSLNPLTDISSSEGYNNWTISVQKNISIGSIDRKSVFFYSDSIIPSINIITPTTNPFFTNQGYIFVNTTITKEDVLLGDENFSRYKYHIFNNLGEENAMGSLIGQPEYSFRYPAAATQSDGNYTFFLELKDSYLNHLSLYHTNSITKRFILDTILPAISITSPENNTQLSRNISINTNATDENSGIAEIDINIYDDEMSIVNATNCSSSPCNHNWASADFDDGSYAIIATARDNAGNTKNSEQIDIEIDNTIPEIYFITPASGIYNTTQLVNITGYDVHLQNIEIYTNEILQLNKTGVTPLDSAIIELTADGEYLVYGIDYDSFGNSNTTEIRNITIDLTAPSLTEDTEISAEIFSPANSDGVLDSVNIIMNASELIKDWGATNIYNSSGDNIKSFNSPDGSPDNIYSLVKTWDGKNAAGNYVSDGDYTINTTIIDKAGNGKTVYVGAVRVDNTKPVTTNNYEGEGWETEDVTITLTPVDANGIKNTYYCIDSANTCIPNISGTEITLSSEGTMFLRYYSVDSVDNTEANNSIQIKIDKTGPEITLNTPENNEVFASDENNVEFDFDSADALGNGETCYLILNGEENEVKQGELGWSYTAEELDSGKYTWNVRCEDDLENSAESETRTFTILSEANFADPNTEYTNLTNVENISDVTYFNVSNFNGSITWTKSIDFSAGQDWAKCIKIEFNSVEVNSSCFAGFNGTAIITMYNLTWTDPQILKDGEVCTTCTRQSYISGVLIFSITGFSVYTTQETPVTATTTGGGGGSGGSSCTATWSCTDWTDCVSSLQTRTCTKTNTCSAGIKPAESQSCSLVEEEIPNQEENTEETEIPEEQENSQGFFSRITGAITGATIGTPGRKATTIIISFLVILTGIYFSVKNFRKEEVSE